MDQPTTRLLELLQAAKHHKVHRSLQLQELWQFIEQLKGFEVTLPLLYIDIINRPSVAGAVL